MLCVLCWLPIFFMSKLSVADFPGMLSSVSGLKSPCVQWLASQCHKDQAGQQNTLFVPTLPCKYSSKTTHFIQDGILLETLGSQKLVCQHLNIFPELSPLEISNNMLSKLSSLSKYRQVIYFQSGDDLIISFLVSNFHYFTVLNHSQSFAKLI